MSITRRGKVFQIRIYQKRELGSGKRIDYNETFRGTIGEAKKREAVLKAEKYSSKLIATSRTKLCDYCEHFFEERRHRHRENSRFEMKRMLERYVLRFFGNMQIGKITTTLLQSHFNSLLDAKGEVGDRKQAGAPRQGKGLSVRTVLNVKRILRSVLALAVIEKLILENPVSKVALPELNRPRVNVFSFAEALALISVKNLSIYGNAFVFALHTGLRPEELMALIWSDVDFTTGEVRIERACMWVNNIFKGFGKPKSNASYRTIKLAPELLDLLREQREKQLLLMKKRRTSVKPYGEPAVARWLREEYGSQPSHYENIDLIFPGRDGQVPNRQSPSCSFKFLLRSTGISKERMKLKWYDLRHTHATYLITMGYPMNAIAERMGHSITELLKTYTHVIPDLKMNASLLFVSYIPAKVNALDSGVIEKLRELATSVGGSTKRVLLGSWGREESPSKDNLLNMQISGAQDGAQSSRDDEIESFNPS